MKGTLFIFVLAIFAPVCILAFTSPGTNSMRTVSELQMAPRFDKSSEKWFATKPSEEKGAGYGPVGSLIRAGPKPFLQHLFFPETYEQAVFKYMAKDGCSRMEAQGNMDFYIDNPGDWTYQKLEEKRGKPKFDYANANTSPQQIALSGTWAIVVGWFFFTFITDCLAGKYAIP